jgi:hypothetical protein
MAAFPVAMRGSNSCSRAGALRARLSRRLVFAGVPYPEPRAQIVTAASGNSENCTPLKQSVNLRFSQEAASPFFSTEERALFPGETIGSLADKIRTQHIPVSEVPIHIVVRGDTALIFDTRSSLARMRAGVPQESWTFINSTGDAFFESEMTKRLLNNGLGEDGVEFIRITGLGENASNLQ